jgi:hypothetical protein
MEEAVEDLRRERAGWPSLAVERELLAELKTFMGDQSASDQTSGAIVERHHHYHRLSGNIQWVLASVFGVLISMTLRDRALDLGKRHGSLKFYAPFTRAPNSMVGMTRPPIPATPHPRLALEAHPHKREQVACSADRSLLGAPAACAAPLR